MHECLLYFYIIKQKQSKMKTFTVEIKNSETNETKQVVTVNAINRSEATLKVRKENGIIMRGEYFPLHYTSIGIVKRIA